MVRAPAHVGIVYHRPCSFPHPKSKEAGNAPESKAFAYIMRNVSISDVIMRAVRDTEDQDNAFPIQDPDLESTAGPAATLGTDRDRAYLRAK